MFYIAILAILVVLIVVVATIIDDAWTNITRSQNEFHWHVIQSPAQGCWRCVEDSPGESST